MQTNYLLIGVIVTFVFLILRGYFKGFLKIAVTFAGFIAIIYFGKVATPYISEYITENTSVYTDIEKGISSVVENNDFIDTKIKENQDKLINSYKLPKSMKNSLIKNNKSEVYEELVVDAFEEYVVAYLSKRAVHAMAFICFFVVGYIAFRILLMMANVISKIPGLRTLNKMAGAALGAVEALLIVWVFFFIVVIFIGTPFGQTMIDMIDKSNLLTILFNTDILLDLF